MLFRSRIPFLIVNVVFYAFNAVSIPLLQDMVAKKAEGKDVYKRQIHDTQVALDRVVRMIKEGKVQATNGEDIPVQCDSICVHGDNESAIAFVTAIRSRLAEEGITCQSFGSFVR